MEDETWIHAFQKALALSEMQTPLFMIWTWFANFLSYDDNHYYKHAFVFWLVCSRDFFRYDKLRNSRSVFSSGAQSKNGSKQNFFFYFFFFYMDLLTDLFKDFHLFCYVAEATTYRIPFWSNLHISLASLYVLLLWFF